MRCDVPGVTCKWLGGGVLEGALLLGTAQAVFRLCLATPEKVKLG